MNQTENDQPLQSDELQDLEIIDGIEFIEDDPIVDLEMIAPHGEPCSACGTPIEDGDRFCPACGLENAITAEAIEEENRKVQLQHIQCGSCGAEIETKPNQRSYICPFCESTYVVELDADSQRQAPEFIIGFAITPEQAQDRFRKWIRDNGFFRPGDLKHVQLQDKLRGIYLPFWSFSMLARSRWRARIGEHWYRTETYTTVENGKTVTRTRQVQETEWWRLSGRHHHYYNGYLVSASRGLNQRDADWVKPFNLPAMKRYQPYFLAGWQAEDYTVEKADARRVSEAEFRKRERHKIGSFLPGDTFANLNFETEFSQVNSDLCLMPVYMMNYEFAGKRYRFMINGQTGRIVGDKPYSKTKIGVAIGIAVGVILLIILLFVIFAMVGGALGG